MQIHIGLLDDKSIVNMCFFFLMNNFGCIMQIPVFRMSTSIKISKDLIRTKVR